MQKIKFVFKNADQKTKTAGIIALALAFAAILTLIISANTAVNGSITNLPFLKMFVGEDALDKFDDELEYLREEAEDLIDDADEELIEEFEDEYGISPKKALKLLDPISLNSIVTIMSVTDELDLESAAIIRTFVSAINGWAFLLVIFVALSALFLNKGWFITATVLSAGFFFTFVGAIAFVIFLGLCIAYCIFVSKVRDAFIIAKTQEGMADSNNAFVG